jgi:polyisoprenyl-teichoic acid--peptidoglycan teichoic acid transferase
MNEPKENEPAPAETVTPTDSAVQRSRLTAAVLSFVWPGLGQIYARRRISALIFALPVLVAAIWLVLQLVNGFDYFALSFADNSFALTIIVLAAITGVWRIASMIHAYASTGPLRRPRRLEAGVVAVLLVAVLVVHGEVINYALATYNFDNAVPNNVLIPDSPTPAPISAATASPSPTAAWTPASSGTPSATPTPTPTPTPAPPHRITILLTGVDFLAGRGHAMNDSILLLSVDTKTYKTAIISLPRDTANFDFYWGGSAGFNTKINNFANLVAFGQIGAPDPAATALAKEVGWLIGIPVDYYVIVDIAGFGKLVDAAHGVCVYNPRAINDPSTQTYIPAGNQCMDGATTLKYVRSRHTSSDYARSGRQQQVLIALEQKLVSAGGIGYFTAVLAVGAKTVQTNFPLKTARNYVTLARHVGGNITQCVLGPPYSYHPDSSLTGGAWTSRLKMPKVAGLSWYLFGTDSRFYGMEGITPAPCGQ